MNQTSFLFHPSFQVHLYNYPQSYSGACFAICESTEPGQWFYLQYRRKERPSIQSLPSSVLPLYLNKALQTAWVSVIYACHSSVVQCMTQTIYSTEPYTQLYQNFRSTQRLSVQVKCCKILRLAQLAFSENKGIYEASFLAEFY